MRSSALLLVALVVGAGCASQDDAPDIAHSLNLEPGQSTVETISTHCGYERLEVLINGKFWMTDGLAADEAGNPTEPDWPRGQVAELELVLLDRYTLRVKAVDSDVAHLYQPVETKPWCE